jgi:hypothetical protein
MEAFREVGARLSNWSRWGADDTLGTLNLISPEVRAAAIRLVSSGVVIPLGLDVGKDGPQSPGRARANPVHIMTRTGAAAAEPGGFTYTDDLLIIHTQGGTQLDGLAHVSYDGQLYNGHPSSSVDERGAEWLGVENFRGGIQGRGILLDVPRLLGVDRLPAGHLISVGELERCLTEAGIELRAGDTLLIRTGWLRLFLDDDDREGYLEQEPGIGIAATEWLAVHDVAFVASDNWGIERVPGERPDETMPVHCVLIRDLGMPLGEMFDLERLSEHCVSEQRWEFLFSCLPLPITGGVGSPVSPIATF